MVFGIALAQIGLDHAPIFEHLGRRSLDQRAAEIENEGAGADADNDLHDVFDEAAISVDWFVMATWHTDESLASALYFSLMDAWPDADELPDAAEAAIILGVEEPWTADVRRPIRKN